MSDDPAQLGSQSRDIFQALKSYAPDAIKAISGTIAPTTQAQLGAQQGVEKGYEDLYNQNQLAAAQTEANVVAGPGQRLVDSAIKYQEQADPEFYKSRGLVSDALGTYLKSYDPTKLTPTEEAEISRGINATTGPVSGSNMNTIRNAATFGAAGTNRWKNFGDAVTKAAAALPNLKSGVNGFQVATTRGDNTGAKDATNSAMGANYGFSTSALQDVTATNTQREAKRKDLYDRLSFWTPSNQFGGII